MYSIEYIVYGDIIMQEAVTTRLPMDLLSDIERFAKIDHVDRSAEMRRLLEMGLCERKKKAIVESFRAGKISTEKAAEELDVTLWEILEIFKKEKVDSQYEIEAFLRDIEAMG